MAARTSRIQVNLIITECLQCVNELSSLNIPNTLDAALGADTDITTKILKFLSKTKLNNLI